MVLLASVELQSPAKAQDARHALAWRAACGMR